MKLIQIVKAYPAMLRLKELVLPFSIALKISRLSQQIENDFLFFAQEEQKLVTLYKDSTDKEVLDDKVMISDPIKREQFMTKRTTLEMMEMSGYERILMKESDFECQCITAEQLLSLGPFIEIVEDEHARV